MSDNKKLLAIKLLHTAIWAFFVSVIGYVCWSGITGHITFYSWVAVGLVVFEGATLAIFKGKCPLTVAARRYSDSAANNFDIFLPEWLAKYNKLIFTAIFIAGVVLMIMKQATVQ